MRPAPSSARNATRLLAGVVLLASLAGCRMQREFRITSMPEGAQVRIDGDLVGRTPLTLPFEEYGTRRFTLYLDGFLTNSRVIEFRPPWYDHFPLDVISEVLLPFGWRDHRNVHFELVEGTGRIAAPDLASVMERAESMRRAGPEGPGPLPGDPETTEKPRP